MNNTLNDPTEASYQFQYGNYYYLFFSSGTCCPAKGKPWPSAEDVYKVMVCRSQDPRKGYVDKSGKDCATESGGTEILGSHDNVWAPGGQGVMNDTEADGPILYYHYRK
jgi:arabinan endo-1,5-alpha-L-arabinosidase